MELLFRALRGGELFGFVRDGDTLRLQVRLPKLARLRGEGFVHFFGTLEDCEEFSLQPFRNEATVMYELRQIERLQLHIHDAESTVGGKLKVYCGLRGAGDGARLTIKASNFTIWDEAFDPVSAMELEVMRSQSTADAED